MKISSRLSYSAAPAYSFLYCVCGGGEGGRVSEADRIPQLFIGCY